MSRGTRNISFRMIILLLALVLGGCKASEITTPPYLAAAGASLPSSVSVTFTAVGTTTPVITTIPNGGQADVQATVRDGAGNVVSGITVNFSVSGGAANGTLSPASATTNASGVATVTLTAVATNQQVTVTAVATIPSGGTISNSGFITVGTISNLPTSVSVVFTAVGTTTPAITAIPNFGQADVRALVRDASSNPLAGVTVNFSVQGGAATGTLAASAVTNASGIATVTYTAVASNTVATINANVASINNSAVLTVGTPPPPAPASMNLTINPLTITISSQATVTVTLLDASGNPAFNNPVTLTITAGTSLASFSPMPSSVLTVPLTTNASGIASATLYSGSSSGSVTVQASSAASNSPQSGSILITSNPASVSLSVGSSSLINGQTTTVTADVRNFLNQAVSDGTSVTFALTYGGAAPGTLSSTTAFTVTTILGPGVTGGIASVTFNADPTNAGPVFITATAGTVTSAPVLITVSAASAASLEFVSATPNVIGIQGSGTTSSSFVKFKVISSSGSTLPGVNVSFTLFGPTGSYLDTLDATPTTSSGSTDSKGEVITILQAGTVAGPCRIAASTMVSGATLTTSSGNISIGGGVPSDLFFSTSVSKFNLDGLGCNNLQSTITAYLADRFGNYNILQGWSVSFATDSGAIDTSNVTDASGITTAVFRTQSPIPADVAPLVGEPNYTVGPRTYNPRDGWLTILVSTTGEEYFRDDNANGVYDSLPVPETFTDLSEPFIDSNDNGGRDSGELFFDWPGGITGNTAGTHNGPNTVWDARIPIFRQVNLVMTGPPNFSDNTTRITDDTFSTTNPVSILRGGSRDFYVFVSDINMNALIAGTKVSLISDKSEAKITYLGGDPQTLADGLSFGPAILQYRVTNNNTSAGSVFPTLTATIDWLGNCGRASTPTTFYRGTITLP